MALGPRVGSAFHAFHAYQVGNNDLVLRQLRQSPTLLTWIALVLHSPN
jgi:hypothetical protein